MVTTEISAAHDTAPDPNKCGPHITPADWLVIVAQGDTKFALRRLLSTAPPPTRAIFAL